MSIDGEIVEYQSAAGAIMAAEVDVQISTAKRYPRKLSEALAAATAAAISSQEVAESCRYSKPVGGGKFATGPSIRLAEIVASCYGNLRVEGLHIATGPSSVTVRGRAWDLESNYATSSEVTRSIMTSAKGGKSVRYSEPQIAVTIQAALSIARRNAIVDVIGRSHFIGILRHTDEIAAGTKTSRKPRARQVVERLQKAYRLSVERILGAVGAASVDDLTPEQVTDLLAMGTAIADGDTTAVEVFPAACGEAAAVAAAAASTTEIDIDALVGEEAR